jgi:hypothetical protein
MRDAKYWAEQAIFVQSACNISAVAFSFSQLMEDLNSYMHESVKDKQTEWRNHHPLIVLFVDKLADLCGIERDSLLRFSWAYDWAKDRAENGGDFQYIVLKEDAA